MQRSQFLRRIIEKKIIDQEIYDLSLEIEDFPIARQVLQRIDNSPHLNAFLNSPNEQTAIVSKGDLYRENISLIRDSLLRGASIKFLDELLDLKILDFKKSNFKKSNFKKSTVISKSKNEIKSKKKIKSVDQQYVLNNYKWIKALEVRESDTGWLGVIIMIYGFGIGFIVHCIQRRTLTPFFYLILPSIISLICLNVFFEFLYMNTNWFTSNYKGLVFFVQVIISTLLGKIAIRHDRLVALELLNDANINKKIFNSTELLEKSFALISKDIDYFLKEKKRNLVFLVEDFKEKRGFKFKVSRVYILLYELATGKEGIHSIQFEGGTIVLMFEDKDDATKYGKLLEAQDFPSPTVEMINSSEIKDYCFINNFECRLVKKNFVPKSLKDKFLIYPPHKNLEVNRWSKNNSNTNHNDEPKIGTSKLSKDSYFELKEKLENIKDLLDRNLISKVDYEAMKKKILEI